MTITPKHPHRKRIHLTRHAQAEHNVASDWTIPDARLTPLGQKQSRELHDLTKDSVQQTAELLVSSPMRRPLETMILGYPDLKKRLESKGKPVVLLDTLQEVADLPCDTPTYPVSELQNANEGLFADLDFSTLSVDYASKTGIFSPDNAAERARVVRRWLRDRPEKEIVVVAHGDILRHVVYGHNAAVPWANAQSRIFTFESEDDEEAVLIEIAEIEPKDASNAPTTAEMAN
ncbi:histidine phosphatase superfamily [Papiliotrema laurentii]|uniref:Histidine phosphatase superfamily n=1 Tax=Papiliotrema laurentii TaxID=5418 RepID=A0AAD9FPP2_PAPLA|nr:histidine phosphatase superfamily [Papiliotrema laurentii]